jgi:hypothetical protein
LNKKKRNLSRRFEGYPFIIKTGCYGERGRKTDVKR